MLKEALPRVTEWSYSGIRGQRRTTGRVLRVSGNASKPLPAY
jgi:hypothetical protein